MSAPLENERVNADDAVGARHTRRELIERNAEEPTISGHHPAVYGWAFRRAADPDRRVEPGARGPTQHGSRDTVARDGHLERSSGLGAPPGRDHGPSRFHKREFLQGGDASFESPHRERIETVDAGHGRRTHGDLRGSHGLPHRPVHGDRREDQAVDATRGLSKNGSQHTGQTRPGHDDPGAEVAIAARADAHVSLDGVAKTQIAEGHLRAVRHEIGRERCGDAPDGRIGRVENQFETTSSVLVCRRQDARDLHGRFCLLAREPDPAPNRERVDMARDAYRSRERGRGQHLGHRRKQRVDGHARQHDLGDDARCVEQVLHPAGDRVGLVE